MVKKIYKCRVCSNRNLALIIDLGEQYLTGVFPKTQEQQLTCGRLELVKCIQDEKNKTCGLLQLRHSFDTDEMYGKNYGYRSGINQTMRTHLQNKVNNILSRTKLEDGDLVIDIGSNDATLLKAYPRKSVLLVGIDPSGAKFRQYYPDGIELVVDYFSKSIIQARYGKKKAKIITSIAMFYDLEAPLESMQDIKEILAKDGLWIFEQSYMPLMLKQNAYDTICHEHLEYYGLHQIKWMAEKVGLKILDVELNSINGGSFSVIVGKKNSGYKINSKAINRLLKDEDKLRLNTLEPYNEFKSRVFKHRHKLIKLIRSIRKDNQGIFGYGASTKGNVILQFCGFGQNDIAAIAERNPDKYGYFTPGTKIPIISEEEARRRKPDYFMVLPWHFKKEIVKREAGYLGGGGALLFPLPAIKIIRK